MWVKALHSPALQLRKPAGCQQTSICKLGLRNVCLLTKGKALGVMCLSVCFSVCVHGKHRTSFVQQGKLVPTQPLLLLRGQMLNTGLDSPSHLLNAAGGLSFLLHLISSPSVHLPTPHPFQHTSGDLYNALFHHRITNHKKYSANFIKKVLKMETFLSFNSATLIKTAERISSLSFNTSEYHFSTLNFGHRQLFISEQDWVCLPQCHWKQRPCLMVFND